MANDDSNYYEDESDDEAPELIEVLAPDNQHTVNSTGTGSRVNANANDVNADNANNDNDNDNANATATACPVTILSGFLGSGKTTLIQHILRSPDHGRRIAVIENEFGEGLAIESLIARDGIDPGSGSLQDLIELPNGCVCCTVKDTLVETLELLIEKRSDLDYILIEASGMADPGPIASVFWLDEALESRLRLDGIVTLVDGRNILGQLEGTEEAARQIAYADRIVLNKVDLLCGDGSGTSTAATTSQATRGRSAPTVTVAAVERALRSIHPTAPILKTSFSKVPDLDWILDADCFSGFRNLEEVQNGFEAAAMASESKAELELELVRHDQDKHNDHGESDHHDHGHHDHDCSDCCPGDEASDDKHHDNHHDHHKDKHHNDHHDNHHNHHNHQHKHTTAITTVYLEYPGSIDVRKLNVWLADILWPNQDETDTVLTALLRKQEREEEQKQAQAKDRGEEHEGESASATEPENEHETTADSALPKGGHAPKHESENPGQQLFRIKGIVSIVSSEDYEIETSDRDRDRDPLSEAQAQPNDEGKDEDLDPRRFIVQAVHDLWDIHPVISSDLYWDRGEERTGKIVVIGKFLREDDLRAGFRACFV